ncbi:hypothetical protein ACLOJK_000983 [Asimina triloba]
MGLKGSAISPPYHDLTKTDDYFYVGDRSLTPCKPKNEAPRIFESLWIIFTDPRSVTLFQ